MSEILDDMFDEALRFEQEEHVEREYEIEYKDKQISSLKAALAEKDAEIARLRRALEFIASSIPTGNGYSHAHLAKKTLEARG